MLVVLFSSGLFIWKLSGNDSPAPIEDQKVNVVIYSDTSSNNANLFSMLENFTDIDVKNRITRKADNIENYDVVITTPEKAVELFGEAKAKPHFSWVSTDILKTLGQYSWRPMVCSSSKINYPMLSNNNSGIETLVTGNSMCQDVLDGKNESYVSYAFDTTLAKETGDIVTHVINTAQMQQNFIALKGYNSVHPYAEKVIKDFFSFRQIWLN